MFIRVATGIKTHFEARLIEWIMAATITWWGLKLVGEEDAWANPPAWEMMSSLMSENMWGWLCVTLGIARLLALTINGTFSDTGYSRISPLVRGLAAGAGAVVWFMVFLSVSAVSSSGSGIYQLPLVLDCWCVFYAFREIGRARAGRNGLS